MSAIFCLLFEFLRVSLLSLGVLGLFFLVLIALTRYRYKMQLDLHRAVMQAQKNQLIGFFHPQW